MWLMWLKCLAQAFTIKRLSEIITKLKKLSYRCIKRSPNIEKLETDGYTIEDYLPEEFFNQYFEKSASEESLKEITKKKSSYSKYDIAIKFSSYKENQKFSESYNQKHNLPEFIEYIYNKILSWNS